MKRLFFMFLAAFTLVACEDIPGPIELTDGTEIYQVMYSDETIKVDGIKFKATAAWTATVSEVVSRIDDTKMWLRLNVYEGQAGDFTLSFELDQNDTKVDRKAEIRIMSGATTIKVVVEQKAQTKDNPEPPQNLIVKDIAYLEETVFYNSDGTELRRDSHNSPAAPLTYDKNGKVTKIATWEFIYKNSKLYFNTLTANLNSDGYIVSYDGMNLSGYYGLTYIYNDGYLSKANRNYKTNMSDGEIINVYSGIDFIVTNGNYTKIERKSYIDYNGDNQYTADELSDKEIITIEYNDMPYTSNVNLMNLLYGNSGLFTFTQVFDYVALVDVYGKRIVNYPTKMSVESFEYDRDGSYRLSNHEFLYEYGFMFNNITQCEITGTKKTFVGTESEYLNSRTKKSIQIRYQ